MRSYFVVAVVVLFAACVDAQKISFGGCPDVPVKSDFDLSKYTGKWYEIEKNPVPFEGGLKCNQAVYEDKGDYVSVRNKGIKISSGKEESIQGKATIPDPSVPAKLKVKFDGMPFKADYWIVDTDYENYSLVYSCFSVLKLFNAEYVWILSRNPTLEDDKRQALYKILDDNKINRKNLDMTKQDCA